MSMIGRRDMTNERSERTSTGESMALKTRTINFSSSTLLMTIWASPVQPTIRVSRLWNETTFTRSSISWTSRCVLSSFQSARP